MSKHTPGPWEVDDFGLDPYILREFAESTQWIGVLAEDGHVAYCHSDNAPLIAAAPELLEALLRYQRLVAYLQRNVNPEEWATHGDWNAVYQAAESAITKATGE